MQIERKSFDVVDFKVVDGAQGIAEIIPSVFGNTDLGNEIVAAGAFADSLARKRTAEGRLRIKGVWGHDWLTPVAITLDAKELLPGDPLLPPALSQLGGLWIKAQFNLDTQRGREAFSDLQFGTCDEFSIGYAVKADSFDQETGIRTLLRLDLFEWSCVLVGMNQATALLGTKSAEDDADDFAVLTDEEYAALSDEEKAAWSRAYINSLPDASFAVIEPGGSLDDEGKTTPRRLRHFPHHDKAGSLDMPHLRNGLSRVPQSTISQALKDKAEAHLRKHMDVSKGADPHERFADQLERVLLDVTALKDRAAGISELRVKEGRQFSSANVAKLGDIAEQMIAGGTQLRDLLDAASPAKGAADDGMDLLRLRTDHERRMWRLRAEGVLTA